MGWVMVLMPVVLMIVGVPIFVILLTTSAVGLFFFTDVPLTTMHVMMFGNIDKIALIAVPFFLFAGGLMGEGGISRRIVALILSSIGHVRGCLGLTAVGACTVFGTMSGSSPATVAAIGPLLYRPLRRSAYSDQFASGVLTSSGAIAIVIPPSIAMILYGAAAEESIVQLFAAGVIPGLLIALMFGLYIYFYSVRNGIPRGEPFRFSTFYGATKASALAMGTPLIILGGIYAGVFSPTEAAGVACVYAIIVTAVIYREITWRGVWKVAVRSMFVTAQVAIIVAAAGVFSWLLTISGVPQGIVGYIANFEFSPWAVLLAINIFLLIVGCLLDPTSAILILTPLLLPIAKANGVDPIHFGIIMVVNLEIGMFTPPFGLNIFVAQALFDQPLSTIYRGLIPFIVINVVALFIITYVPDLSMFLARKIG